MWIGKSSKLKVLSIFKVGEWSAWTQLDPKDCALEQGNAIREVANIILTSKIKHYKVILKTVR